MDLWNWTICYLMSYWKKEDTHMLSTIDHMSFQDVAKNEKCCCRLMQRLQKKKKKKVIGA